MPTVVISYRRADTGMIVGRIFERLEDHFGKGSVFMDIENMPPGKDFRQHIREILQQCDILVALIGPNWAALDDSGQPRLFDSGDWVRIELETALVNDIPVVPVLIERTPVPKPESLPDTLKPLAFRHACEVAAGRDFHVHMQRLLAAMDAILGRRKRPSKPFLALVALGMVAAAAMAYLALDRLGQESEAEAIAACNAELNLRCISSGGVFGSPEARSRVRNCRLPLLIRADHSSLQWKDVWTTSVYSYAPGGGGPGGGLDNDELRVGGWGDWYFSLISFQLPPLAGRPSFAAILLYAKESEGASVGLSLDRLISAWTFPKGDRLWWKDRPGQRAVSTETLPAPKREQWYIVELTSLVNEWLERKSENHGIQIRPVHNFGSYVYFVSSDAPDKRKIPRLLFCS